MSPPHCRGPRIVLILEDLGTEHVRDGDQAVFREPDGGGGKRNPQSRSTAGGMEVLLIVLLPTFLELLVVVVLAVW